MPQAFRAFCAEKSAKKTVGVALCHPHKANSAPADTACHQALRGENSSPTRRKLQGCVAFAPKGAENPFPLSRLSPHSAPRHARKQAAARKCKRKTSFSFHASLALHYSAPRAKIGGGSEKQKKNFVFVLLFSRLALSLQKFYREARCHPRSNEAEHRRRAWSPRKENTRDGI